MRGKLSELFCAVLSLTEQFLKMTVCLGLGLVLIRLFTFSIWCVFLV